jgi:hypothetical protein
MIPPKMIAPKRPRKETRNVKTIVVVPLGDDEDIGDRCPGALRQCIY